MTTIPISGALPPAPQSTSSISAAAAPAVSAGFHHLVTPAPIHRSSVCARAPLHSSIVSPSPSSPTAARVEALSEQFKQGLSFDSFGAIVLPWQNPGRSRVVESKSEKTEPKEDPFKTPLRPVPALKTGKGDRTARLAKLVFGSPLDPRKVLSPDSPLRFVRVSVSSDALFKSREATLRCLLSELPNENAGKHPVDIADVEVYSNIFHSCSGGVNIMNGDPMDGDPMEGIQ